MRNTQAASVSRKYPRVTKPDERATIMASGEEIGADDLQQFMPVPTGSIENDSKGLKTLDNIEKEAIEQTLEFYSGNISQTARSLGISRGALYRRLQKHQIPYDE